MVTLTQALSEFVQNLVAFVLMIILAIVSFFFTVFVVNMGARFAGYGGNEYVVLSATLLVAAAIIAGGISPLGYLSETNQGPRRE
jgi:restriction endonuclease Mrr